MLGGLIERDRETDERKVIVTYCTYNWSVIMTHRPGSSWSGLLHPWNPAAFLGYLF